MSQSIVFFGSGPVAAESLRLLREHQAIEAVVTKPTTLQEMTAVAGDTPVFTVSKRLELDDLLSAQSFKSKLGVLIDFGIIVSKSVIDYFPSGIINSHFSILPEWRGADPISFAILSGQQKTGVSLMLLDEGMDTGKILTTKSLVIDAEDTTPSLTDKLIILSNGLLEDFIPKYTNGTVTPRSQSHPDRATYSRKLSKEDGIIDWSKPAASIEREIRAFTGWPKSRTQIAGKDVILAKTHVINASGTPGDVIVQDKALVVFCGDQALAIDSLQPAGKKEMTAEAFLAGHKHLL